MIWRILRESKSKSGLTHRPWRQIVLDTTYRYSRSGKKFAVLSETRWYGRSTCRLRSYSISGISQSEKITDVLHWMEDLQ